MLRPDEPHAASSMVGSTHFIILAASVAMRPYSAGVFAPICQGPSISLPRHQNLTPCGCSQPCARRRSDSAVPPGWLQYSTRLRAASGTARAEVDREHRLDAGAPAPVDELVGAERVGLGRQPGEVEPPRPALDAGRRRPPSCSPRRSCRRDSARSSAPARAPAPARRGGTRARRPRDGPARRCRRRRSGRDARRRRRTAGGRCRRWRGRDRAGLARYARASLRIGRIPLLMTGIRRLVLAQPVRPPSPAALRPARAISRASKPQVWRLDQSRPEWPDKRN